MNKLKNYQLICPEGRSCKLCFAPRDLPMISKAKMTFIMQPQKQHQIPFLGKKSELMDRILASLAAKYPVKSSRIPQLPCANHFKHSRPLQWRDKQVDESPKNWKPLGRAPSLKLTLHLENNPLGAWRFLLEFPSFFRVRNRRFRLAGGSPHWWFDVIQFGVAFVTTLVTTWQAHDFLA